eukprot:60366-Prymnesium_polylepis.1
MSTLQASRLRCAGVGARVCGGQGARACGGQGARVGRVCGLQNVWAGPRGEEGGAVSRARQEGGHHSRAICAGARQRSAEGSTASDA